MRRAPNLSAPTARARRGICGPRRNSPARSCWPPAKPRFSSLRGCFATASAAICICPNSPCWNGTAPNATYDAVMADSVVVIAHAAQATGIGRFSFRGRIADPFAEPELLTVAAAFERFAGIDLLATIADGEGDRAALAAAAKAAGADHRRRHLVRHLQQGAGRACRAKSGAGASDRAVRVSGARKRRWRAPKPSDPRVAERFEVYACGVELANGFGELTDAAEQRRRFTLAMDEKQRRYGERYPLDEDFLAAVARCRKQAASRSASTGW